LPWAKPKPNAAAAYCQRLIGIEEGAFELRPEPLRATADWRRGHDAGVRTPGREQAFDVVAWHQDIAVGHDDSIVGRGAPAFADIVQLRIFADGVVADQQPCGDMRMVGDEASNEGQRGIVGRSRAEDDLVARIIEIESRAQRILDVVLQSADRPNQTDAGHAERRAGGAPQSFLAIVKSASVEEARQTQHAQRGFPAGSNGEGSPFAAAAHHDQNAADVSSGREDAVRSDNPDRDRHGRAMSRPQ
jgi:hypothetical protein